MRVVICDTPAEAVARTVAAIAAIVRTVSQPVLGLATGATMEPVYAGLVAEHRRGLGFAAATTFNLDEYVGLSPGHERSFRRYMQERLFDHVDIDPVRTFMPQGDGDIATNARRYEASLRQNGPVGLQLLGIGRNGHIGFNEPGSSFGSRTRGVVLSRSTRAANARFFASGEALPLAAITMGIATILEAKAILLLATGAAKAGAVRAAVEGPLSAMCPASALQLHPDVTLIADAAAASQLQLVDYYRDCEAARASGALGGNEVVRS